jgi:hypothetical protein
MSPRSEGKKFVPILGADRDGKTKRAAAKEKSMADMSRYASSTFIKVDNLAEGPEEKVIAGIGEGKYEKPVVTFTDGTKLSLNGTNVGTLIRAFGKNDEDWIGQRIEVFAGTVCFNGKDTDSVLVRALNPLPAAARTPPKPQPLRDDLNDEIPFN